MKNKLEVKYILLNQELGKELKAKVKLIYEYKIFTPDQTYNRNNITILLKIFQILHFHKVMVMASMDQCYTKHVAVKWMKL